MGRPGEGPHLPRYPDDVTKRAASLLRLTGIAGAALLATGCGVLSPVQTNEVYIPADGVPLSIPGLELQNLAVVTDAAGSPGTLVGQAVNGTDQAVDVSFALEGGEPARATVPAFSGGGLSDGRGVTLPSVPVPPGSLVVLNVTTQQAGQNVVRVPVLARTSYYTTLPTPTAVPSASPSPSPSASASPSPSPSASESPSPSPSPSTSG